MMHKIFTSSLVVCFSFISMSSVARAELILLMPMTAGNQPVLRAGPKGEPPTPILKRAPADAISKAIALEASRGSAKFMLALDEHAQRTAGATALSPTYLLRSQVDGGFARQGFWLSEANNVKWLADPYVEMVVDKQGIDDGSFEEQLAHELGHVLLGRLVPRLPDGLSRATHSSLTITDYPTAFDEGFAIHFQALARELSVNPKLKALDKGQPFKPFLPYWQSNLDRSLRLRGMRDNLFIHQQLPLNLKVGDATSLFDLTHFKNAQQMLSSEGVIATCFYHLLLQPGDTHAQLNDRYKSLVTTLRTLNSQKLQPSTPLFMTFLNAHVQRVPAARTFWVTTVVNLTYGATINDSVVREMTALSALGQEGRTEEFSNALKESRAALATLATQAIANPQRLSSGLGPELWVAFKRRDGGVLTVNLNTAEKINLALITGLESLDVDLVLADRQARGPYTSVDNFATRRNLSAHQRKRIDDANKLALSLDGYQRE